MLSQYYDVIAVSSPGAELDEVGRREGVRTIPVPMERGISLWKDLVSLYRLIRLFQKEKPYAVHAMCGKAELLAMMAAWITRVPVRIDTVTGLTFPTTTGLLRKILIITQKIICYCATYINPEGFGVKQLLEEYHITNKPLHVIGSGNMRGIDMQYFDRTAEVMDKASVLRDDNVTTFCFVGRIVHEKGIDELISAFTRLYNTHKDIRLLLVGPVEDNLDPVSPDTLRQIYSHPAIHAYGMQTDVRPYLVASDIYVFPSYREGFPNSLLEAGALGLPAIVTAITGSSEIIQQGVNGEFVSPQDDEKLYNKMKEWIEHPSEVHNMARNARTVIARKYEQKALWQALLKEYEKLIPRK